MKVESLWGVGLVGESITREIVLNIRVVNPRSTVLKKHR